MNGTGPGFAATHTVTLVSSIQDHSGLSRIGQNFTGMYMLYRLRVTTVIDRFFEGLFVTGVTKIYIRPKTKSQIVS